MNILMLTENDPAGTAIMFRNAINRYTNHACNLITTSEKYSFGFKKDIHWPDGHSQEFIVDILQWADVFHFHILSDENMTIGPIKVSNYIKGKKIVHHHHGHPCFRSNPEMYRSKYKRLNRKVIVSTPDLLLGIPEATYIPNLVPIEDIEYLPAKPAELHENFTVCQSPTKISLKDTDTLLSLVLKHNVDVDIIMNTPHSECLRRKKKCHVVFDHLRGYYGVSSLEGLSMNKHVVANLSDFVRFKIAEFAGCEIYQLPWTAIGKFEDMLRTRRSTFEFGREATSRNWMKKYFSDRIIVKRLIEFYETL